MLTAYMPNGDGLAAGGLDSLGAAGALPVWVDLSSPTPAEEQAVEALFAVAVPTREEMREIEPSSRLYVDNGARTMSAFLVCRSDGPSPTLTSVSFILKDDRLVTVRYDEPRPFALFGLHGLRALGPRPTGAQVLVGLLDTIIDRAADILERVGEAIDALSRAVFEEGRTADRAKRFSELLKGLGQMDDLISKVRESLVSLGRLLSFLSADAGDNGLGKDQRGAVKSLARDVGALTDHCDALSNKIQFLLDATLGLVTIDQNNIIKIFAVLSVVLMPPTLVASIYGMNFKYMPELESTYGYPLALAGMLIAAVVPYLIFRWKRWL